MNPGPWFTSSTAPPEDSIESRNIGRDEVDPGNVETDCLRGQTGNPGVVRVDAVGTVDGGPSTANATGWFQLHLCSAGWNVIHRQPLLGKHIAGFHVDVNGIEGKRLARAAPGIRVGGIDELAYGANAVPYDERRNALEHRGHLVVDDQHPIVPAGLESLDQHRLGVRLSRCQGIERADPSFRFQIDIDPPRPGAIDRLQHHRVADPFGHRDRLIDRSGGFPHRNRHPRHPENVVRQVLAPGDLTGGMWSHRRRYR